PAKWGVQIAGMIFQTHSSFTRFLYFFHLSGKTVFIF
ncbi:MAG: DUF6783 domain-containing protein, partial [Blautia wexlerae]